jgi:DNA-binding transcriptional ArsR family regulator
VVRFVFSLEDLTRTRFAISPMWELTHSLVALRDRAHAAVHEPWLRSLGGRLRGIALEGAAALMPPRGFTPDFLLPAPSGPLGSIEEDLATLRATPEREIVADMRLFATQHARGPEIAAPWLADPRGEAARLADVLEAYWTRALAPVWPRIRALLEADIAYRARRLAAGGPAQLYADLAPGVTWSEPALLDVVVPLHDATHDLGGRALVLMPSVFSSTRPAVVDRDPWQPTVVYPARGLATLWQDTTPAPEGLARLLGGTRAAVLADLGAARSTTEIAERLSLSPATASHHVTALRDAGLIAGRREGRAVLYSRTALGDQLVHSSSAPSGGSLPGT